MATARRQGLLVPELSRPDAGRSPYRPTTDNNFRSDIYTLRQRWRHFGLNNGRPSARREDAEGVERGKEWGGHTPPSRLGGLGSGRIIS